MFNTKILIGLFIACFFLTCNLAAQTDSKILQEYNSLKKWQISNDSLSKIINYYFKKEWDQLIQQAQYPKHAQKLCSEAIILVNYEVYPDTFNIDFKNKSNFGFEKAIKALFKNIQSYWINIPPKGLNFNLSIGFDHGSNNKFKSVNMYDSTNFTLIVTTSREKECFFGSDEQIKENADGLRKAGKKDSAKLLWEEILQRNPMKEYHHTTYEEFFK